MKKILKNILQGSGAVVIALAVFFSTANSYTVLQAIQVPGLYQLRNRVMEQLIIQKEQPYMHLPLPMQLQ